MNCLKKIRDKCDDNSGELPISDIVQFGENLLLEFVNELLEDRFDLFKMPDGFERHFCDDGEFLYVENVQEKLNNFLNKIYNV